MGNMFRCNKKGGITPTGTKRITSNGTYNVTNYANANVNVSSGVFEAIYGVTAQSSYSQHYCYHYENGQVTTYDMSFPNHNTGSTPLFNWSKGGSEISYGYYLTLRVACFVNGTARDAGYSWTIPYGTIQTSASIVKR